MSGITFGSVGDIIAVGQIAWGLAQALSSSRGSAKEYQGLVKELRGFDQALLQVIALWQNYEESQELNELGKVTRELVREWRDELLQFRLKFTKRYGSSLSREGSGNWFKDTGSKIVWMKEKEDILELRRKLHLASDALTMLILAAMGKSNKLASTAQAVRVELVHGLLQESIKLAEEQMSRLKIMDEKLDLQAKSSDMILTTVKSGMTHLIDMRSLLSQLRGHILAQQTTPRGIGTHWQQAPVTLEDALGFIVPIPLELVNSWKMFDMILSERFEKHPGHRKVQQGEFAIEDDATGRELSREYEWSMCFRSGQKVDMSVLFSETDASGNHCPRCQTKSDASSEARIQCANPTCKMWFQRVVEINETEANTEANRPESKQREDMKRPFRRPTRSLLRPGDFQRVKLMSKISKKQRREQEYQKRMRDDLYKSGLNEDQVEQILKEDGEKAQSDRPIFTRFSRRHLSIETLNRYRIDFEYDEDPEYLVVTRWVPEYEQEFLWSHTKEIRGKRGFASITKGKTIDNYDPWDEQDYGNVRIESQWARVEVEKEDDSELEEVTRELRRLSLISKKRKEARTGQELEPWELLEEEARLAKKAGTVIEK